MRKFLLSAVSLTALTLVACQAKTSEPQPAPTVEAETPTKTVETLTAAANAGTENGPPTIQEAKEFLEQAEEEIVELRNYASKVYWIQANFITEDTNALAALAGAQGAKMSTRLANEAKRFNDVTLPADMRRKMDGLKRGSNFPAPEKEGAAEELAKIMTGLEATYGTGKFEVTLVDKQIAEILKWNPKVLRLIWDRPLILSLNHAIPKRCKPYGKAGAQFPRL